MTKQDIIREIAKKEEIPLNKAKGIVENIFNMITESLENHEKVTISSFGSFGIVDQQPKRFKNPKTKKETTLPKRKRPVFSPSSVLKKKVAWEENDEA